MLSILNEIEICPDNGTKGFEKKQQALRSSWRLGATDNTQNSWN